jgi:hypothetical protein
MRFERRGSSGVSCEGEGGAAGLGGVRVDAVVEGLSGAAAVAGLGGGAAVAGLGECRLRSCARRARDVEGFGATV